MKLHRIARYCLMVGALLATHAAGPSLCGAQEASDLDDPVTQLWANLILDSPRENYLLELDVEPKLQIRGEPKWWSIGATPLVEYYPNRWLDLTGEMAVTYTNQNDNVRSVEVTPRAGIRLHILSNFREEIDPEVHPPRKLAIANLSRIEYRNFWYSGGDLDYDSSWRFRNRIELKLGLNRSDFNTDGAWYLKADFEAFVNIRDEIQERFATRIRTRAGVGYRFAYKTRLEVLYIRDEDRNTLENGFETSSNILDVRLKKFF